MGNQLNGVSFLRTGPSPLCTVCEGGSTVQAARFVHPDKQATGEAEFKLLGATRDLAQLYTETGAMPFDCPGLAKTRLPDPVPIAAATRWPVPQTFDRADQEIDPQDSHKEWTKRRWRWIGKCQSCAATDFSVWAYGAAPPRLVGWLVETAHPVPAVHQQVVDFWATLVVKSPVR